MIALIIYLIGIFITPIILKKYFNIQDIIFDKDDISFAVISISVMWPLSLVLWLIYLLSSFTVWIYNKV